MLQSGRRAETEPSGLVLCTSLQNYGEDEPVYDGIARTFSSTYHAGTGTLQLYAHHVTDPRAGAESLEYHMTQIDSWGMTGNIDTFRRGAVAFRNARDLGRRQRETFIQAAARAGNTDQIYDNTALHEIASQVEAATWQDSHDELQQHISKSFVEDGEDNDETPPTP
ncbi:hypothetical protein ED733_005960 [Metarhizium rileyi]|uniref:Uncharacterized protein n=1 Tax=Metarhizium rileyi (strain RCEF 4871) TaxID=1649241 RepID=A0A5C6GG24_METRR|nr:hypothetical protein ED733_005960 [Metarhizium rileyi]